MIVKGDNSMAEESYVWTWNEGNPNIIARIVPKREIMQESKGFKIFGFNIGFKQAIVGPGEIALFIKNGKVVETVSQDKMTDLSQGFLSTLGNMFGGGDDFLILFATLAQIDYLFPIGKEADDQCPQTADAYPMRGSSIFEFQVDPNNAVKIIPLMRSSGMLLKNALVNRLFFETNVVVFENLIAKYNAADFKGNMEIIRNIENVAQIELQKTFTNYGVMLNKLITKWERNDFEKAQLEMQKVETQFLIANKEHEDWMKRSGIKHEQVMQAIDFQFHEDAETIIAEERKITLQMQEKMEQIKIDQDAKDLTLDRDLVRDDKSFQQDMAHQTNKAQVDDYEGKLEIDRDRTELQNLVDMKRQMKEANAAEYQATKLESEKVAADTDKHAATMDAEKAKYNLGTYRDALGDERSHQVNMMAQTANLMNAAKQHVPHTLVQGGGGGGGTGGQGAQMHIVEGNVQQTPAPQNKQAPAAGGVTCPSCNATVPAGQKFCGGCGKPVEAAAPEGGGEKFCGQCGAKVPAGNKFCGGCGGTM